MNNTVLLRNGAAPLRRGADLHGLYVLHVTLTLTLHFKVSDCMLPKSPGFTDPEDVTHKMHPGSPGFTDPEDVTHKMQAGSPLPGNIEPCKTVADRGLCRGRVWERSINVEPCKTLESSAGSRVLDSLKPTSIPKSHRQSTFLAFSKRGAIASTLTAVEDDNGTLENGPP